MPATVNCPSCHVRLRLPPAPPSAGMTCPRCLAQVPYPEVPPTSIQTTPSEPARPAEQAPQATGRSRCPRCGRPTEPMWVFCAYCEEPLHAPGAPPRTGMDRDVRRDNRALRVILGLLGVLGGLGTVLYFIAAVGDKNRDMLAAGVIMLLFLGLISTGIMFWWTHDNPSARGIGRVVLGTFALIGLVIASGCSLMLALFVVCIAGGMRF